MSTYKFTRTRKVYAYDRCFIEAPTPEEAYRLFREKEDASDAGETDEEHWEEHDTDDVDQWLNEHFDDIGAPIGTTYAFSEFETEEE